MPTSGADLRSQRLVSSETTSVQPQTLGRRTALISLDLETDYGTGRDEALSRVGEFLDVAADLGVPLTVFVEGQFFETRRGLCRSLRDRSLDLQLHCYDHSTPGDTPALLARSVAAYSAFMGRPPEGYRAHTYRLAMPLYEALIEAGFRWDSSLMRAIAQGSNRHRCFRAGDYFVLGGRLVEFPVATWRTLPLALNHAHRLLMKSAVERLFRLAAPPGPLVVYNLHMTDLVRCRSLSSARRRPLVALLHRYMWSTHGDDTMASFRDFISYLRRLGYTFRTTSDLYDEVAPVKTQR